MCLIPLSPPLARQRKVHAWLQLGMKMSVCKCFGNARALDLDWTWFQNPRQKSAWRNDIIHPSLLIRLIGFITQVPKIFLFLFFFHLFIPPDLRPRLWNLSASHPAPNNWPRNSTAVFVITSSALIDVCGDLLIFHEFPLCFNCAASPTACVNCSQFAPERRWCEQLGCVFVDGKRGREGKNATNFHRKALDQMHLSSKQ